MFLRTFILASVWLAGCVSTLRAQEAQEAPETKANIVSPASNKEAAILLAFRDAHRVEKQDIQYTRWLSLYHVAPEQIDIESRLLFVSANSVSTNKSIAIPWAVPGSAGRLFRVDLRWYGWTAEAWERMGQAQPYFRDVTAQKMLAPWAGLKGATYSQFPVIRGDYFTYRVTTEDDPDTQAPEGFYQDFLRTGANEQEFHQFAGINIADVIAKRAAEGGVVVRSNGPTNHNRKLGRGPTIGANDGYLWISYDTQTSFNEENVVKNLFNLKYIATEQICKLPNGGQAYGIFNAEGKRLAFGDPRVAHDKNFRDSMVWNGRSCISCHAEGIRPFKDVIRTMIGTGRFDLKFPDPLRLQYALDFYGTDLERTIARDQSSYNEFVMICSGWKSGEYAGHYNAGWKHYADELVDLPTAARELALSDARAQGLFAASGNSTLVAIQAGQAVPRDEWEGAGEDPDQSAFAEAVKLQILLDAKLNYRRLIE